MAIFTEQEKIYVRSGIKMEMIQQVEEADIPNKRKIELLNQIKEMSYNEVVAAFNGNAEITQEQIRDFEGGIKKFLKYGLAAMILPGPVGLIAMYLYRKSNDPCNKRCKSSDDPTCEYKCQLSACDIVLNDLKKAGSMCNKAKNPESCKKKIQKQMERWNKKKQQTQQRLNKARMRG